MDLSQLVMVVVPSVCASRWEKVISLCGKDGRFCYGLGLHPYFIENHDFSDVSILEQKITNLIGVGNSGLVAIGEIGLDATRPNVDKQILLLEMQLKLAEKYKLPVILHVRKLHSQLVAILKKYSLVGGVIHAFSGSYELMMSYIGLGFKIGVGPVITWRSSTKTQSAIKKAPLESLVLETDAPDMFVEGDDKAKASPLDVIKVFDVLSALRAESRVDLQKQILINSTELFNKSLPSS